MIVLRFIIIVAVLIPSMSVAAPSISSTSGTFTHGSSVTISGSSFGSKGGTNANKPLIWADFETSINPTSLGHYTAWASNQGLTRQSSAPQFGTSSWNVTASFDGSGSFSLEPTGGVTTIYMYGKRYYNASIQSDNLKFFRIWSDNIGDSVASTSNSGIILDENCYNGSRFQAVTLGRNAWNHDEFLWRQSTSGTCSPGTSTGNGYYEFIQNGVQQQIYNNNFPTEKSPVVYGSPSSIGIRVMDNFTDAGDINGTSVWMDDLYVDNTFARVMIGNASTFAASTNREIQIPTAWADGSITVQINRGSFGASDSAYLYVIDSSNVVNTAGYPVTFGAGGGSSTGGGMDVKVPDPTKLFRASLHTQ